jgi:lipopolysaccharide transport system ATP-binding protein
MSDLAIRVANLGKRYRIGLTHRRHNSLRDLLTDRVQCFFRPQHRLPASGSREVVWALKDVSFEVKRGEILGIIGPNGSGKSTLLKVLSRVTEPTSGYAQIKGQLGALLEVGTGFHPELTGRENIFLNGAILGMKKAEITRKFDEIVAFAEVEKFLDTPVKHYSSGMFVRLAFSVAAHLEPEILLVDEVLAVGDAAFQKKCLGKMENVAQHGRTVIFVSHNMTAITRLCPRAILLNGGQISADGLTIETVETYLQDMTGVSGVQSWSVGEAPGTDELKLPLSVVSVEDKLKFRIDYHVKLPRLRFRCLLKFYTKGRCAFSTIEPFEVERTRAGNYYSVVTIPSHLLTEGEYTIGLSIFSSKGTKRYYVKFIRDIIAFHVIDPLPQNATRGDFTGYLGGLVRPALKWDLSFESAIPDVKT